MLQITIRRGKSIGGTAVFPNYLHGFVFQTHKTSVESPMVVYAQRETVPWVVGSSVRHWTEMSCLDQSVLSDWT